MQNQAVSRALRRHVRPGLIEAGFEDFTGRKAWRRNGDVVEVVEFQAAGATASFGVGCTPFSFSVRAGVLYAECEGVGDNSSVRVTRPDYQHCTFQFELGKRLRQPLAFRPWADGPAQDRADTWAVWDDCSNVGEVVEDAAGTLLTTGMSILAQFNTPTSAYAALLTRDSSATDFGSPGVWMPGAPGSPRWTDTVRCLAAQVGRNADDDLSNAPVLDAPNA